MTSSYPVAVEALIPQAERFARELGKLPSQNQLKATLHVRAEKAKAVLVALRESGFDPAVTDVPEPRPTRRLHAVSDVIAAPPGDVPTDPVTGDARPEPSNDDTDSFEQVTSAEEPVPPAGRASGLPIGWVGRLRANLTDDDTDREPVPADRPARRWPLILLALPAFVAIWSGWVGLGVLTGFGPVHPLPGIADGFTVNSAITLPIGVETYAAYALRVWLTAAGSRRARRFARHSALGSLVLGAAGQVAYHLMTAHHLTAAPWPITTAVSCLPVLVLGFGAALAHLQHNATGKEFQQ